MGDPKTAPTTKPVVVVTGFGPFGGHKVNASSVVVKQLKKEGLHNDDVDLVVTEMPVEYDQVKTIVPKLWQDHNPLLVVHTGVSGIATQLMLEQMGHNAGYDKMDVVNKIPGDQCCVTQRPKDCDLESGICMEKVCTKVNASKTGVKAKVSHDAGRYLCEFAYFSSLHINQKGTAFIHVPPLDSPYTADELTQGLRVAVNAMISQVLDS